MATPSTYAHFENAVPTGDDGLAVGAKGSEVTVADSNGTLYNAGTSVGNLIVHASTSGLKIAYGQATVDDSKAITTGLTSVIRAFTQFAGSGAPTGANGIATLIKASYSAGTLTLKGYRPGAPATSDMQAVSDGTTATVDWIAIGT